MFQFVIMDSWYNAYDAGSSERRAESQFILHTALNIIDLSWLKVDE